GTVTAPSASTVNSNYSNSIFVNETLSVGLQRANSAFTHTILITVGSFSKSITGVGASTSWNPTTAEENQIYAQIGSNTFRDGTLQITTFYNGQRVRSATSTSLRWRIPSNSAPIFSSSQIS